MEIYHLIDRVESVVSYSTKLPLTRKIIVDEHQLLDVVDQMRTSVPEDVREAQRLLQERDTILSQAQREAQQLRAQAEEEIRSRIEATDFVKLAQERAQEIVDATAQQAQTLRTHAEEEARRRREDADQYALEVLQRLDNELTAVLASVRKGIQGLVREKSPQG